MTGMPNQLKDGFLMGTDPEYDQKYGGDRDGHRAPSYNYEVNVSSPTFL